MKFSKVPVLLVFAVLFPSASTPNSQAIPTATQGLKLSAFGAASGVFTGFFGGRNISVTAGVDLSLRPFHGFYPSLEVRGTYPIHNGQISSHKDALGGIRFDRSYNHIRPYLDFFAGRGEIDYQRGGYTKGSITYISSSSNVYSPGGGIDFGLSPHLSIKTDYQFQIWSSPLTSSGSLYSNVLSIGAVYHLDFNHSYHRVRHPAPAGEPPSSSR